MLYEKKERKIIRKQQAYKAYREKLDVRDWLFYSYHYMLLMDNLVALVLKLWSSVAFINA